MKILKLKKRKNNILNLKLLKTTVAGNLIAYKLIRSIDCKDLIS